MKRRSFISLMGAVPLLRVPLWSQESKGAVHQPWGPPALESARAEHQRVVLSFTPVEGAASYRVQVRSPLGKDEIIDSVLVQDYSVQGLKNGAEYGFRVAAVGPRGTTALSNELKATPCAEMDWTSLAEAFRGSNPTRTSCPFWMVHGDETEEQLREFMAVIYRFGFEGVTLHPYDYRGFLEENNWKSWRIIVDAARKLGLTVWEQDDKNYPCGYAAGRIVVKDRKLARWEITLGHQESVHGPKHLTLNIRDVLPSQQHLVAVVAAGPGNKFEDLTDSVSNGQLQWSIPEGDWEIFTHGAWQPGIDDPKVYPDFVHGEVRGYIDYLSEEATDLFVQYVLAGTCDAIGFEHVGKTWKGFYIDEPGFYSSGLVLGQPGGFPYTPDFLPRFQSRFGYSIRPVLPLLWVERGPKTNGIRHDYMEFVSTGYDQLFLGKQTRFAEVHGMQIDGHVREDLPFQLGGGAGSDFRMLESYSMGGFDHIFDQWYTPEDDVYWRQPKMASSVSHYQETPLDEAMVEHFAATGWRTGLTEMKAMMDWTTCRGVSRVVPCGLDTRKPPVWEDQPEFWLYGENPLAPYFHAYQVMANRGTMMIRGGRHVAKAIILDTAASAWVGPAEELWKSDKALSQAHFDYDNVSYEVFSDAAKCRIEGDRIHLGHEDYEWVVLPGVDAIPFPVARRLLEFYESGGTAVSLGPGSRIEMQPGMTSAEILPRVPIRSADGRQDDEVKKIVSRIWGDQGSGRGHAHVTTYKDIAALLYSLDVHDVWIDPNLTWLQYYHRRLSGQDIYFFNNEGEDVSTTVRLRGARGIPEFWDPVTGKISQAPCYSSRQNEICLRLDLRRYESLFVVINPSAAALLHLTSCDAGEVVRGSNEHIILRKHTPGTFNYELEHADGARVGKQMDTPSQDLASIKLREGWSRAPLKPNGAIYKVKFDWPGGPAQSATLVIGNMTQVIHAKLNGKDLGTRFTYPFRFDLSAALRPGQNELELKHVERHTFTSQLGDVLLQPYYEIAV
ncbi:MAG: glycosyl hydrolase [Terriglobia bacterium]